MSHTCTTVLLCIILFACVHTSLSHALPAYSPPSVNPHQSMLHLDMIAMMDPYGFDTGVFVDQAQEQNGHRRHVASRSPRVHHLKRGALDGATQEQNDKKAENATLAFNAQMLTGIVDITPYYIMQPNEHTIKLFCDSSAEKRRILEWIPGTRMIWRREGSGEDSESQAPVEYYLVLRRIRIVGFLFEYEVRRLRMHELFYKISLDYTYSGHQDESPEDSAPLTKASSCASPPHNPLRHSRGFFDDLKDEISSWNPSFTIDTSRSFDALNFNYDTSTQRASQEIELYRGSFSGASFIVTCTNCYAHITFLLRFTFVATLTDVQQFSLLLNGQAVLNMETDFLFEYFLDEIFTKNNILSRRLSSIEFSVGGVPVVIVPQLTMHAEAHVKAQARAHFTHKASYRETITAGITYTNGRLERVFSRSSPHLFIGRPEIASDNDITASLNAKVFVIPEVAFRVYDLAPLVVRIKPYVELDANIGKGQVCAQNAISARWQFYWGLLAEIQMDVLSIPSSVYALGGKSFPLSNTLPYPKDASNLQFEVVKRTPLQCRFCSGCLNLESLADKLAFALYQSLPTSFTSFIESSLGQIGNASLPLAAPGSVDVCHLFKTAQIGFGDAKMDFSLIASGKVRLYYGYDENSVRQKTASFEDVNPPLKKFAQLELAPPSSTTPSFFSICPNDNNANATGSVDYEFLARQILSSITNNDIITVAQNTAMTLRRELRSAVDNAFTNIAAVYLDRAQATLSSIQLFSVPPGTSELTSSDMLDDQFVDYEQLIFDIPKSLQGEMSTKDFVFQVQTLAQQAEAQIQVQALPFISAIVDEVVTLTKDVEYLRVPLVDSSDVWKYIIETVDVGGRKRDSPLAVSIYSGYIHQLSQASNFSLVDNGELSFSVDHLLNMNSVDPSFWIKLASPLEANAHVRLKVKEYRYLRSGGVNTVSLSDASQFVLFQDASRRLLRNQIGIRSEAKNENGLEACKTCAYKLHVTLELENAQSQHRTLLWNATFLSTNGSLDKDIYLSHVASSTGQRLTQLQEAVVFVKSESLSGDTFELNLMTNDIVHFGSSQTSVSSKFVRSSETSSPEILYYKLPAELIRLYNSKVQLQLSVKGNEGVDPEIFIQKAEYPRRDSFSFTRSGLRTQSLNVGFVAEETEDYYVGVSSVSSSFEFDLTVQHLEHAEVLMSMSLVSNPNAGIFWLSEDHVRDTGLMINFTIQNPVHEFSPSLFDLSTGDAPLLRALLHAFDADAGGANGMLQFTQHLSACLDRAISPNVTDYRLSDFVLYSPRRLTFLMPPMPDFKLNSATRIKMKDVSSTSKRLTLTSTSLPAQLFSTLDPRNVISPRSWEIYLYKPGQFSLTTAFWIWVGVCVVSVCCTPLVFVCILAASTCAYIPLRKSPVQGEKQETPVASERIVDNPNSDKSGVKKLLVEPVIS